MSENTDTDLAFKVQENNDPRALDELIERHSGIYVDMIRKFGGKSLTEDQTRLMMGEKDYNIFQAAKEYDPTKSKFSTFLAIKTKYLCLTGKTQNKKSPNFVDFEAESFHIESNSASPDEESSNKELFSKLSSLIDSHPNPKVRKIFEERYFSTTNKKLKSWREIAKVMGLSIQGCIDIHNRTLPELHKQINAKITF